MPLQCRLYFDDDKCPERSFCTSSIATICLAKAGVLNGNQFVAELGLYNKSQTAFGMLNGEEIRCGDCVETSGDWPTVVADIGCVKTVQRALQVMAADKAPKACSLVAIGTNATVRAERGDIFKAWMAIPARARALYLQKSNQIMVVEA